MLLLISLSLCIIGCNVNQLVIDEIINLSDGIQCGLPLFTTGMKDGVVCYTGTHVGQLPCITVLIVDSIKQALRLVLIKSGHACWMKHGMELYHAVTVLIKVRYSIIITIAFHHHNIIFMIVHARQHSAFQCAYL